MASKNTPAAEDTTTKAVAVQGFSRQEYGSITSYEQAFEAASALFGGIVSAEELGDGFAVWDKKDLLGKPFLILGWEAGKNEKYKGGFTIVRGITPNNEKLLFVDGSTGIQEQLQVFTAQTGRAGGLLAEHGLRCSDYTYKDESGEERPARTYYISENAEARR